MQPKDMNNLKGFKLIAIRPLKDCAPQFLKVLVEGEIYKFYNEYEFKRKDENDIHSDVESIEYKNTLPENLYLGKDKPTINISAVVGKNGSGKSTLFELLFLLIYSIALKNEKIDFDDTLTEDVLKSKKYEEKLKVEIFYLHESSIKGLRYEGQDNIQIKNYSIEYSEIKKSVDFNKDFFYNVIVNYSHHGLNTKNIGLWIKTLFHKNDGYQVPASINPYRIEGNIDVNKETELVKSRLLSNILTLGKDEKGGNILLYAEIVENKKVVKIRLNLKDDTDEEMLDYHVQADGVMQRHLISDVFVSNQKTTALNLIYKSLLNQKRDDCILNYKEKIENYIIRKLYKIAKVYPNQYGRFLSKIEGKGNCSKFNDNGGNSFENYLIKIKEDKSHVTFKLWQAVNYLYSKYLENKDLNSPITTLELAEIINNSSAEENIIYHLPPPIFDVELIIKDETDSNEFLMSDMSSGEQQKIHSIQSIFYHLRNINSVFNKPNDSKRITYNNVNIMLDEIELYFHPDYQREYISSLLNTLGKLEKTENGGIDNINILFSTHSPFILSDIPVQNTLRLKRNKDKGKAEIEKNSKQTFGANIHDLLHDSFFMNDGFMGAFAKQQIEDVIRKFKISKDKFTGDEKQELFKKIKLIGEPFLRERLLEMYCKKFEKQSRIQKLEAELAKLKKED